MSTAAVAPAAAAQQLHSSARAPGTKHSLTPTVLTPVPETTPLVEAVGSALPLYLYRPASARQQVVATAGGAPEAHQGRDMLESSEPQPVVPEWFARPDMMVVGEQHDAVAMVATQQHCGKMAWAGSPLPAQQQHHQHEWEDAGVVPTAPTALTPAAAAAAARAADATSAPRRSLSLSAINHQAGGAQAVAPTPSSARAPLLFRGLSAADLSLLSSIPSSGAEPRPGTGTGSPAGTSGRLPHVLAAAAQPLTVDAVMARSALYRMGSGGDDDGGASGAMDASASSSDDDGMMSLASPMEASPRSSSPMLPDLALGASAAGAGADDDEEGALEQLLRAVAAHKAPAARLAWLQRRLREHQPGALDTLLAALWEDCDARGLFRYDVASCATRVLREAPLRWVVQLNEGRATKKRPTELKLDAVLQPFDAARFHFGKAAVREALVQFEPLAAAGASSTPSAPSLSSPFAGAGDGAAAAAMASHVYQQEVGATGARLVESSAIPQDPTLVLINVSPIEHGHVLLTPRVLSRRPQRLGDAGVIGEALAFVREVGSPAFRLGYNALGAYASINHLHFQGYYLHEPFPCELADVAPLASTPFASPPDSNGGAAAAVAALGEFERAFPHVRVGVLQGYPVLGWVVEAEEGGAVGEAEREMALVLERLTAGLEQRDQPYNVFVVDCGRRAFVWPQCFAARQAAGQVAADLLDSGVNPAAFEIAGHLLVKRPEDYEQASDAWAHRLLGAACLPADEFGRLTRECLLGAVRGA